MKRTGAYRITADICFGFAVLSLFSMLEPLQRPMAFFALATLAVSIVAVYCKSAVLRFLLALLPALAFAGTAVESRLVFPALVWLYLILVLTRGNFQVHMESYRRSFKIMLAIWLGLLIATLLLNVLAEQAHNCHPSIFFALGFLALGVIAMRRMQMNAEVDTRWQLANTAVIGGIPLIAAGCSALLYLFLVLLRPVPGMIAPYLARALAWLVNFLFRSHPEKVVEQTEDQFELTPEEQELHDYYSNPSDETGPTADLNPAAEKAALILTYVLIGLALAAAVLLIVRLVRRFRAKPDAEEYVYEEKVENKPFRKRKGGKDAEPTNANAIRSLYQSYMRLMQKRGIRIRKATTSGEILNQAELSSASPDAERLRELYLKVRYTDGAGISDADAEEAAECLRRIREDDSWKKERTVPTPVPEMLSPNLTFDSVRRYLYNDYLNKP